MRQKFVLAVAAVFGMAGICLGQEALAKAEGVPAAGVVAGENATVGAVEVPVAPATGVVVGNATAGTEVLKTKTEEVDSSVGKIVVKAGVEEEEARGQKSEVRGQVAEAGAGVKGVEGGGKLKVEGVKEEVVSGGTPATRVEVPARRVFSRSGGAAGVRAAEKNGGGAGNATAGGGAAVAGGVMGFLTGDESILEAPPEEMVKELQLRDAPLDLVIGMLEKWMGRIVLRPQALPAALITISINSPVVKSEAVRAIESVLALNNIGVVPMGDKYLKIVELANKAKLEGPELLEGSALAMPPSGKIATKIYTLSYLKASDVMAQLNTILNAQVGGAILFAGTNSFMVTESIANLQKLERVLREIDKPAEVNMKPMFVVLQNARATELLPRLQALLQGAAQAQVGSLFTLSADDRTNQVIVFADERRHELFRTIIEKLDAKADPNTQTEVIYLNNATAADVVKRLTELISGQLTAATRAGQAKRTQTTTTVSGGGTTATQQGAARTGTQAQGTARTGGTAAAAAPAAAQAARPTITQTTSAPGTAMTSDFSPLLSVVSDERANAVIVTGTASDIGLIKGIVAKLDITLLQVRIEVVVVEVRLKDAASTGLDTLGLNVENNKLMGFVASGPGFAMQGSGEASFVTMRDPSWLSLTGILQLSTTPRKSFTHILSTPSIVTSHNKQAFIFVGEQRPVISSYLNEGTSSGYSSGYRSTVSMLDIGLRLEVTPLIGKDGSVQMTVKQKVEDVIGQVTIDDNEQPIIGRRETQSFITVKNGEIIVLGGLQRKDGTKSTSRLGPIPFIGDLLGKRSRDENRTDLIFFLRPVILTGNSEKDNAAANKALSELFNRAEVKRVISGEGMSKGLRVEDAAWAEKREREEQERKAKEALQMKGPRK